MPTAAALAAKACVTVAAMLMAGCAGDAGPGTAKVANPADANVHVYVSNQSFQQPWADLLVTLDGAVLFDGKAHVAEQHNWTLTGAKATPGTHLVKAMERTTGAQKEQSFTLAAGREKWVVVDYWSGDGGTAGPEFTISLHDEPVMFA